MLTSNNHPAIITDFTDGQDRLVLPENLSFEGLSISQVVGDTMIQLTRDDQLLAILIGVDSNVIEFSDFIVS